MEEQVQPIQDKTTPRLPVNRNMFVLIAVIVVLVVVMFQTHATQPTAKPAPVPQAHLTTPDAALKLTEELKRESDNYEHEHERANVMKAEAERALADQQATMRPAGGSAGVATSAGYAVVENKTRSNIAFSLREGESRSPGAPDSPKNQLADIRELIEQQKQALAANIAASQRPASPPVVAAPVTPVSPQAPADALQTFGSTGKTYRLFEGQVIETVLVNRLNGSFTGPVDVMVSSPVYSHDTMHVLIPKGSRIIGEAEKVGTQGQQRLALVFHRVIMPDGASIDLNKFVGLDAAGATGIKDKVDNHWGTIFATAAALGVVQGFTLYGTGSAYTANGLEQYRQGVANSMGQAGSQILNRTLSIPPQLTIREGQRVRVFLNKDIDLPAYEKHSLPGDI
jgi:type IV secretory pathway VirB10-like protein